MEKIDKHNTNNIQNKNLEKICLHIVKKIYFDVLLYYLLNESSIY